MGSYTTKGGVIVPERAVRTSFSRASGPGGQHVNTSSTRVQVRLILSQCELDATQRKRLEDRYGPEIRVDDASSRSQWRNRSVALERALALLDEGMVRSRPRVATRATRSSVRRRLEDKARNAKTKQLRRRITDD